MTQRNVPTLDDVNGAEFAVKWTGHQVSDEIGAMLAASRARTFADFRSAFDSFAVPGQNMIYADAAGNIGQVMAVRLPARDGPPPDDVLFDLAASNTGIVLQLTPRRIECVSYRDIDIFMRVIFRRVSSDHDFIVRDFYLNTQPI